MNEEKRDPMARGRKADRWYYHPKTFLGVAVVVTLATAGQLVSYGRLLEKVDLQTEAVAGLSASLKDQVESNKKARFELETRIYRDLNRIYDLVFASHTGSAVGAYHDDTLKGFRNE